MNRTTTTVATTVFSMPSRELVTSWYEEVAEWNDPDHVHQHIASRAAQWGYEQRGAVNEAELQKARDEELEACCKEILSHPGFMHPELFVGLLRAARRPKPKSQAEEAIKALDSVASDLARIGEEYTSDTIRAALERLRELENADVQ